MEFNDIVRFNENTSRTELRMFIYLRNINAHIANERKIEYIRYNITTKSNTNLHFQSVSSFSFLFLHNSEFRDIYINIRRLILIIPVKKRNLEGFLLTSIILHIDICQGLTIIPFL